MAAFTLHYFAGRGLAEVTRLLFAATNTPYEDVRLPISFVDGKPVRAEFDALKAAGKLPMGQVPILTVTTASGTPSTICQSKTIARYVAAKTGLLGSTPEEGADIDSVCEAVIDILNSNSNAKDDAAKASFLSTTIPTALANFDRLLGDGYAVGGKLSQADVYIYHLATWAFSPNLWGPGNVPASDLLKANGKVAKIVATVAALPGVAAWEAGRAARNEQF